MNATKITVTKRVEFDMGHRLPNYSGKCRYLHGHRYILLVSVTSEMLQQEGSEEGMVLDFARMKKGIMEVVDHLDHRMMLYKDDPVVIMYEDGLEATPFDLTEELEKDGIYVVPFIPTAENIAVMILTALRTGGYQDIPWSKVQLFETPTCSAEVGI